MGFPWRPEDKFFDSVVRGSRRSANKTSTNRTNSYISSWISGWIVDDDSPSMMKERYHQRQTRPYPNEDKRRAESPRCLPRSGWFTSDRGGILSSLLCRLVRLAKADFVHADRSINQSITRLDEG
jgi:hypothetical protein